MTSTYPSVVAALTNPTPTAKLNSPSHSSIHGAVNDEVVQMQTFIGTNASTVGTLLFDIRSPNSKGGGHVQGAAFGGTGQTTFTKGDTLVATSASVLSKLAVGLDGQYLKSNSSVAVGVQWANLPGTPSIAVYSISSTLNWVKPSVFNYLVVEVVGGGGGGGSQINGANGGGGGGYARKIITASTLQATELIVIGKAGLQSSVGGATVFGTSSYVSATGGDTGQNAGAGGTGVGDFTLTGFNGGLPNLVAQNGGGNGGDSPLGFGKGGVSSIYGGQGRNGQGYGAGGAGSDHTAGSGAGIATGGLVIVTQF